MARTVGPLMSLDASGSVAGTLTFSKWKGRGYVRQLVIPANPKTVLQVSTRAIMKFLSQAWGTDVDPTEQASYNTGAAADSISPFNEYIRQNLQRWTQFLPPSQATPAAATGTAPTFTSAPAATGGVGQVTIGWDVNLLNQAWGMFVFRSQTTGFTPARDNLVAVTPQLDTAAQTLVDTGLPVGTYYYNFIPFSDTGKLFTATGQSTGVVT